MDELEKLIIKYLSEGLSQQDISELLIFKNYIMKKLKKLSRNDLKEVQGGIIKDSYGDMCTMGPNDSCAQYGVEYGLYMGTLQRRR
ncbi:hypothetical protein OK18_19415 [Chryseobacterium gallinarum]|uniref:Uncharacterized protein n=1 Tax=Chryseobacterium gallinarum TaxID=1324352 RepID=A0A0G3MBR0_CHRGL|nr:hypothetical protein [Chryseobacterium gallinarum]AKK74497.1 hypothetical protein OK18_19415 [Chryseobacterium gallinarum]